MLSCYLVAERTNSEPCLSWSDYEGDPFDVSKRSRSLTNAISVLYNMWMNIRCCCTCKQTRDAGGDEQSTHTFFSETAEAKQFLIHCKKKVLRSRQVRSPERSAGYPGHYSSRPSSNRNTTGLTHPKTTFNTPRNDNMRSKK